MLRFIYPYVSHVLCGKTYSESNYDNWQKVTITPQSYALCMLYKIDLHCTYTLVVR